MIKYFIFFIYTIFSAQSFCADSNTYFGEQWAVKNSGQPIYIRSGKYVLTPQYGVTGESAIDINYIEDNSKLNKNENDIIVAVIDTGVDLEHPDLEGRFWKDPSCQAQNSNLCIGKNILNPKLAPIDDKGHGTHVAGIIAANDNSIGIKGITTSNIKIMPLKVLSKDVTGFGFKGRNIVDYFARAIEFAVKNNADVINLSVGFPQLVLTQRFRNAIKSALVKNIPVVVAAGNNKKELTVFPCSLDGVICVGAIDNVGVISSFSNYGHMIDILAPGESIVSTYPSSENFQSRKFRKRGYEVMQGTSQAAPFVSGIAAMIKSQHPGISLNELKARLFASSVDLSSINKVSSLNGLVDMKEAVLGSPATSYVYPNFKENAQVVIKNKELEFNYDFKIDKLVGPESAVELEIVNPGSISFAQDKYRIEKLASDESAKIVLKGKFDSLLEDSIVSLKVKLTSDGISRMFDVNLSFSMSLDALEHKSVQFDKINPKLTFLKRAQRTYSKLNYVLSATNKIIDPEYFVVEKVNSKSSLLHVLESKLPSNNSKSVSIPNKEAVLNVLKGDFNLDGVQDYLVLTYLGSKVESENAFYIYYLDNELRPLLKDFTSKVLFKDDSSTLLIKSGTNLFNFDKKLINFSWMKQDLSKTTKILTPVVIQNGLIPAQDNSSEVLDFIMPALNNKPYVLVPEISGTEIELKARVLISNATKEDLKNKIESLGSFVQPWESMKLEAVLSQPSQKNEALAYVLSVGEYSLRRFYKLDFTSFGESKISTMEHLNPEKSNLILSGNNSFEYIDSVFTRNENSKLFFKLDGKFNGRVAMISNKDKVFVQEITTTGYNDPLLGFISTANVLGAQKTYFESRYFLQYFNEQNKLLSYPVNRESSFPGVEFSETMEGVFGLVNGVPEHGVFVNSVLLYGNQVHAIFPHEERLIRPLGFTLEIPSNCSYMSPVNFTNDTVSSLALNCLEENKVTLKYIQLTNY